MKFDHEWWEYMLMPFMSGIIGWGTNVLALWMTFNPVEFFGVELFRIKDQPWGLFGWQGIIPTKAEKIARKSMILMTKKLFNIRELFNRLDPYEFSASMKDGAMLMLDDVINDVATKHIPNLWQKTPQDIKDEISIMAYNEHPRFMANLMVDMQENIDDILDITDMAVTLIAENKQLLGDIFLEVGEKEFIFLRRSGFYFGFLFGVCQMLIWMFYDASWILPVFGFMVGWSTNSIALKIIFKPTNPIPLFGGRFKLHGLFLQRQDDVAVVFSRVQCVQILHVKAIWESILKGPKSKNFYAILRAHTIVFVEQILSSIKSILILKLGSKEYSTMKEDVALKIIEKLPEVIDESYEYTTKALNMEETMKTRLAALTSDEFEGVLHPAFEEDEITLIAVGGVLGMLVGLAQLYILFR